MAVIQISRIQHRRGLQQDLPQLAGAELGWSVDERRLYIGNGTVEEGAPSLGRTEILTQYSDILGLSSAYQFKGTVGGVITVTGVDANHPIERSLQDKLDDFVNVRDFGATGNGISDDTAAIQRAIENTFSYAGYYATPRQRRTIYFPAGVYKVSSQLTVYPSLLLQGDSKTSTKIVASGTMNSVLIYADSEGQTGSYYGATVSGAQPVTSGYALQDLSITYVTSTGTPCVIIDGGNDYTFNRVGFYGGLTSTVVGNTYNVITDRGNGKAAVYLRSSSTSQELKQINFHQCEFGNHNRGIEAVNSADVVSTHQCVFNRLYQGIKSYNSSSPNYPNGYSVTDNFFTHISREAIYAGTGCDNFMCFGNYYHETGYDQVPAASANPVCSVLNFNADNNFTIGEQFADRSLTDESIYPAVESNGYDNFAVRQDVGITDGRRTVGRGKSSTLMDDSTGSASVGYLPAGYTNIIINYTITRSTTIRTGKMRVVYNGSTYRTDEEYEETADVGVTLSVNASTGDIEYVTTATGTDATLTYSVDYFSV